MLFAVAIDTARTAKPGNLVRLFFSPRHFSNDLISHAWLRTGSELHGREFCERELHGDKYQPRKSLHYITRLMDTFHTIQGARKGASTSIGQISTVHMCTHTCSLMASYWRCAAGSKQTRWVRITSYCVDSKMHSRLLWVSLRQSV